MRAREIALKFSGDSLFLLAVITFVAKLNDLSAAAEVAGAQHVHMKRLNRTGKASRLVNHQFNTSKLSTFFG